MHVGSTKMHVWSTKMQVHFGTENFHQTQIFGDDAF